MMYGNSLWLADGLTGCNGKDANIMADSRHCNFRTPFIPEAGVPDGIITQPENDEIMTLPRQLRGFRFYVMEFF